MGCPNIQGCSAPVVTGPNGCLCKYECDGGWVTIIPNPDCMHDGKLDFKKLQKQAEKAMDEESGDR